MRTNGFALYMGAGASAMAREAALRVSRYACEVLTVDGSAALGGGEALRGAVALAYSLGGSGLPLVHGFAEGSRRGEYSLVGARGARLYAERDPLGTRGLWAVDGGPSSGSVASDYRLLPEGASLVPAGPLPGQAGAVEGGAPSLDEAARELASLLERSVSARVAGHSKVAVAFSGGLDSSIMAHLAARDAEVVLCSAFAPGSRDEGQSERAARLLGLPLERKVIGEEDLARAMAARLPPGEATTMDRALWCVYAAASELAGRAGARLIVLGQLADELFGGYMKYAVEARERGSASAEAMMRSDAVACARRAFLRDEAACSRWCEVRFPYADADISSFAAGIPFDLKVRGGERKAVLRAAAVRLGIPEELAAAPKKAAQFSSGAARLLKRL
ncbi:MAG: asparagine synthase [Nitrososphaerota archaeon]|jgi:asparagine synthase (glutamine-hydrolysing)|nr:asparagine synthase [Nitrososphaerota archaeon]MDG6967054.1 asparagine synthase [Nitrososphaerota archaeon]MDG6979065.1 asparagine synthase [Nitrososphaerota archaeon]MDG7005674.1 asparagine synthase [Nitrososphaerota archaeon]MDG7021353.1 asparagine synthase [Nitrososphaerota archaeon]